MLTGSFSGNITSCLLCGIIDLGVRKINYYTYMAKAGAEAISNKEYSQFHDVLLDAQKAMKENVATAIKVFANI